MNKKVYLFGDFGTGYTQYPDDGARTVLRKVASVASPSAQIQTRMMRDGALIYYIYLRRMEEGVGQYLGFAALYDSVLLTEPDELWGAMEDAFESLVIGNRILTLNDREHIVTNVATLGDDLVEAERVRHLVEQKMPREAPSSAPRFNTPPAAEGASSQVPPSRPTAGSAAASAAAPPSSKPRSGGRAGWVCFWLLLLSVLALGAWAFLQWDSVTRLVDGARSESSSLTRRNLGLSNSLSEMRDRFDQKVLEVQQLNEQLRQQDSVIMALMTASHLRQPLVVTEVTLTREGAAGAPIGGQVSLIRGDKLQPHIRYMGLRDGTADVQLKLQEPGGLWGFFSKTQTYNRSFAVSRGTQTFDFAPIGPNEQGYWDSGNYVMEVWVDGECRARKEFYVR